MVVIASYCYCLLLFACLLPYLFLPAVVCLFFFLLFLLFFFVVLVACTCIVAPSQRVATAAASPSSATRAPVVLPPASNPSEVGVCELLLPKSLSDRLFDEYAHFSSLPGADPPPFVPLYDFDINKLGIDRMQDWLCDQRTAAARSQNLPDNKPEPSVSRPSRPAGSVDDSDRPSPTGQSRVTHWLTEQRASAVRIQRLSDAQRKPQSFVLPRLSAAQPRTSSRSTAITYKSTSQALNLRPSLRFVTPTSTNLGPGAAPTGWLGNDKPSPIRWSRGGTKGPNNAPVLWASLSCVTLTSLTSLPPPALPLLLPLLVSRLSRSVASAVMVGLKRGPRCPLCVTFKKINEVW